MKKQSNTLFSDINKEQLANLTTVVKETINLGIQSARRNFSAAELWDIQRRKRTFTTRRLSF
ncbi:MAG: hypothetical protein V4725_00510 [Bacteroidota bacterium]|nr:hypothetical protein [Ferruginibacter sp.]